MKRPVHTSANIATTWTGTNKTRHLYEMKKVLYLFCVLLITVSCGTSRRAQRQQGSELASSGLTDDGATRSKAVEQVPVAVQEEVPVLTVRLDSLLLTADTLLQRTQLGLHIVDLTTGTELYARQPLQRMRPASTEKMVTAIAALDCLGPSYQLTTQLLTTSPVKGGTLQGDLYVKGTMDPLLTQADVRALASRLKAAGVRTINGRLVADASFKDGDEYGWGWCWDDENPTLSPLLVGGKPGLAAALKTALKNAGVTLKKGVTTGTAPASARELAALRRPLTEVLQPMMKESDNLCAEAVFYQLSRGGQWSARGKHYSRKQAAEAIYEVLNRAGGESASSIADGSGLSLYNYQTPETFTRLLAYAAARPDSIYVPLLASLPIAAVDGTLKNRMDGTPAAGNVRAKTGSVTAVSTLVGYTMQRSTGHLIAFAIMNNGLPRMAEGRALQDKICILLSE